MRTTADKTRAKLWTVADGDNVAVALEDTPAGAEAVLGGRTVRPTRAIRRGHKVAVRRIAADDPVIKYGIPIGRATQDIAPGEHVHTHNLETLLRGVETLEYRPAQAGGEISPEARTFSGYRRAKGQVGVRNEIWVIPTVGCVDGAAGKIAAAGRAKDLPGVDGVYALPHPFGCSQLGDDLAATASILASLAAHPNVGGAVLIGLGCESNQLSALLESAPYLDQARIRTVIAQEADDEIEAGVAAVSELAAIMARESRTDCPVSDLVIGVKCGGSDGLSGLTANPLVGRMTDRIVSAGGTAILTEIPELFGAEQALAGRCASRDVFDRFSAVMCDFRRYFIDHGESVSENPSPGNIEGGITTLEEKSLGAVQKAGAQALVTDVIRYGERVRAKGLAILEAPGNDAVSSTALTAAGAQILLFTTGRGTPLGFPAPTIKIASNSALAARKPGWIDFDAGAMLGPSTAEEAAEALFDLILSTASGAATCNELNDERAIALWKRGVTL